jgi:hypothetical protein
MYILTVENLGEISMIHATPSSDINHRAEMSCGLMVVLASVTHRPILAKDRALYV